jgi:uncharacterized cupredoxin-like copper-binding protein
VNSRLQFVFVMAVILLLLVGCGASTVSGTSSVQPVSSTSATPSGAQVVHVTLSDNGISTDRSTFYVGMPYQFVVTNTGQATYQFMMGQRGWQGGHMPMGWYRQMTPYWSAQIAPGTTTAFDYTFPESAVGSRFGLGCSQMGWQGGMWYPSTVQPQP